MEKLLIITIIWIATTAIFNLLSMAIGHRLYFRLRTRIMIYLGEIIWWAICSSITLLITLLPLNQNIKMILLGLCLVSLAWLQKHYKIGEYLQWRKFNKEKMIFRLSRGKSAHFTMGIISYGSAILIGLIVLGISMPSK